MKRIQIQCDTRGAPQTLALMLRKFLAARAFSMAWNRARTIGLLPTSSIWRPPGWTSRPKR